MRLLRNVGLEGCVRCLNVLILTWGDSIRRHLPHALHTWSHRSRDSVRTQPALWRPGGAIKLQFGFYLMRPKLQLNAEHV